LRNSKVKSQLKSFRSSQYRQVTSPKTSNSSRVWVADAESSLQ